MIDFLTNIRHRKTAADVYIESVRNYGYYTTAEKVVRIYNANKIVRIMAKKGSDKVLKKVKEDFDKVLEEYSPQPPSERRQ